MVRNNVHFMKLTEEVLKQIRGAHGYLHYRCPICNQELDTNDIGKTVVSFDGTYKSKRRKREYVHGQCFNSLVNPQRGIYEQEA